MLGSFFGGGFGCGDEYGGRMNRAGWAEKSAAASRREQQAKKLLDEYLDSSSNLPASDFPHSNDCLVTADIHLTNPCWLTFRKYALSKGCKVHRREATQEERIASGDKRRGKLYVISATLPTHPSKAIEAEKKRREQAVVVSAKRKEREHQKAEEKAREEQSKSQRVAAAYNEVVANVSKSAAGAITVPEISTSSPSVGSPPAVASLKAGGNTTIAAALSPAPLDGSSILAEDPQSVLKHADLAYENRLKEIRLSIFHERKTMETQLDQKQKAMEQEALKFCQRVKQSVLTTMPLSNKCSMCHKKCKILVGECVHDDCKHEICAECLDKRIESNNRCYICKESWLGTNAKSSHDDTSIDYGSKSNGLAKFVCKDCLVKHPYDNFNYAYCCQESVCQDHQLDHDCCVCSGHRGVCTNCGIQRCQRCRKELCDECSFKEGCMCSEKSGRAMMIEEMGFY